MEYARLGSSGLQVSRIALGCMSYGNPARGFSAWSPNEEDSQPFFAQAVELGITFWDTANAYTYGSSEEIVGRAIRTFSRRADIVLATKLYFRMHDGPGGQGISRKAVMEQGVARSLRSPAQPPANPTPPRGPRTPDPAPATAPPARCGR